MVDYLEFECILHIEYTGWKINIDNLGGGFNPFEK